MNRAVNHPAPPSDDRRWKLVEAAMRGHGYAPTALIETLHCVQEEFGFITDDSLTYISQSLNLSPSKVLGVTTFYSHFKRNQPGKHTLSLCTGTTCHVKGSGEIIRFLKEEYGLKPGDTTSDGLYSITHARCVGACGLAPVIVLDGEVIGKIGVDEIKDRIRKWFKNDE